MFFQVGAHLNACITLCMSILLMSYTELKFKKTFSEVLENCQSHDTYTAFPCIIFSAI